jgi:hypothetical protein
MLMILIASLVALVSCEQPTSGEQENSEEPFDKNTMKGSWEFVSATDGKTYEDVVIRVVGTPNLYSYENSWPEPNPWTGITDADQFAIIVDENDTRNMIFDADPVHGGTRFSFELRDCSSEIGGTMVLMNITAGITYSFTRTEEW